jgi:hypothetical protein
MTRIVLALLAMTALQVAPGRGEPQTNDVIQKARQYLDKWQTELSGLVASEEYTQHLRVRFGGSQTLRLRSDVLLVRVRDIWVGFRDIAEVDGRPISGRGNRLQELFVTHPMSVAVEQARRISDEGSRYNLGRVHQNFNVPTTALRILEPDRAARIRFRLEPPTTMDGQAAAVIAFEEKKPPTLILLADGRQYIFSHGRFWVDPANGRILATELRWRLSARRDWIDMTASVHVTYRQDAKVGVSVPQEMTEKYETSGELFDGHAVYTGMRRFTVKVDDSITSPQ